MDETADDTGTTDGSTGSGSGTETGLGEGHGPSSGSGEGEAGSSSGEPGVSSTGEPGASSTGAVTSAGSDGGGLVCTDVYDPVCGVDGETYDHPCSAMAAGVEVERDGPCFGDCEGSCSIGSSPLTLGFALVAAWVVRSRPRR